jgi:hypothetical protein
LVSPGAQNAIPLGWLAVRNGMRFSFAMYVVLVLMFLTVAIVVGLTHH